MLWLWLSICLLLVPTAAAHNEAKDVPIKTTNVSTVPALLSIPWTADSHALQIAPNSTTRLIYLTFNFCSAPSSNPEGSSAAWSVLVSNTSDVGLPDPSAKLKLKPDNALTGSSYARGPRKTARNMAVRGLPGVWDVALNEGFGNWTGYAGEGLWVTVSGLQEGVDFEVGVAYEGPIHAIHAARPSLGDTTSNQSLIYSPILAPLELPKPAYPNYTIASPLPMAASLDTSALAAQRIAFAPTIASSVLIGLGNSQCAALRILNATRNDTSARAISATSVVQGREGWQREYLTEGLQAGTNYTAWIMEDSAMLDRGGMWGPIMLRTKQDAFPCPLAHRIDLCPSIGYAAALDRGPIETTVTVLPSDLADTLATSLNAFSTSLLSMACGRDLYSPVSSCADCFAAYRDWLCRVSVPHCTEDAGSEGAVPPRTITRGRGEARSNFTASPSYAYNELLPCLATCRRAERACPSFLGLGCPVRGVNAALSYGYDGPDEEDNGRGEGEGDGGVDEWGNRWCSGS